MIRRSLILLLLAITITAGGCGSSSEPIRIGVLVDCTGVLVSTHDWALAAAELPLLQHGGKLEGAGPASGVEGATAGGRPIELVEGCTETGLYGRLIQEATRLVETEHVDVVLGTAGWTDAVAMRDVARRHPTVPFIIAGSWPREATVHGAPPNLYRFEPDVEQSQAGLASFAYNRLGWRRAATVAEDEPMGWGSVAAFTAQFCAFGGKVDQVWTPAYSATGQPLGQVPKSVDGVAMFEDYGLVVPAGFLQAYVNRHPDAPRSLLMSLWYYPPTDAQALGPLWPKLRGVVGAISGIANPAEPAWRTYHAAYHRAFPGIPVEFATESDVLPFRNAMAAVLQAIETVNGDLGNHHDRLMAALARLHLTTPYGAVRLDQNHQAVIDNTLVRIAGGSNAGPIVHPVMTVSGVDQSLGGVLHPDDSPSVASVPCVSP